MSTSFVMPNSISTVQQAAFWAQIDSQNLAEAQAEKLKQLVENVATAVTEYGNARVAANTDSELSQAGVKAAVRRAAERAAAVVKGQTDPFIKEMETRAGVLANSLANSVKGEPDVITTMLIQERRALLADMKDGLLVQQIYASCCENGTDELTCRAVETAPQFMKLATPDLIEMGRATRAARMNPDMASELEKVRFQRELAAMSRNGALRELSQLDDSIAEQAKGMLRIDPAAV